MEYYDLEKKKNVSILLISGRGGDPSSEQTNDPDMKFWGLVHTSTASQWSFQLHTVTSSGRGMRVLIMKSIPHFPVVILSDLIF